jgi:hypothetical protein
MDNYNETSQMDVIALNATSISYLKEITKWTKFLSILGFVGVGLMVVLAFAMGTVFSSLGSLGDNSPMAAMGPIFTVMYLAFAALYFFPVLYLYRFSKNSKEAVQNNCSDLLSTGLGYLKSHYKFVGILMVVLLSLYALILVGTMIVGAAALI